jgi:PKD repeat protein
VTVRFAPTTSATAGVNVNFTADGDSVSRLVKGTGTGTSTSSSTVLSVSPSSVVQGGSVTATWSGIAAPKSTDWIGLYAPATADGAPLAWIYVSCSQTAGTAKASGSCAFPIPKSVAAGTYQLRLFSANSYTRLATSATFTVTAATTTTLSATPSSVLAGGSVTATWSGIAAPKSTDWIGLYVRGTADGAYLAWIYVSCSKTPGSAKASGSCTFLIPGSVAAGTYELRLFAADGYTRLATSNAFSVTR